MSKFRARQLDATKPIPIYLLDDISDSADLNNASNRTVPQLPTGMEKEEESEHHLQQAIFHNRVIPVPEVYKINRDEVFKIYPSNYKQPRQLIHIHPFSVEQDIPEYDLDSEDEAWLAQQGSKGDLNAGNFEEMMDKLEKSSGLRAVTLQEAKLLLKQQVQDDELITAVFDYWLNKRLKLQRALVPQVKTEKSVNSTPSDPYIAFRKRTEKMQTRKNRKNDESSYEKMLKLRRDLLKGLQILKMVSQREEFKSQLLRNSINIFEKRYAAQDWTGCSLAEAEAVYLRAQARAAFTPLVCSTNHQRQTSPVQSPAWLKLTGTSPSYQPHRDKDKGRRDRRHRRLKHSSHPVHTPPSDQHRYQHPPNPYYVAGAYPSVAVNVEEAEEQESTITAEDEQYPDGQFTFMRRQHCQYLAPRADRLWCDGFDGGGGGRSFSLASLPSHFRSPSPDFNAGLGAEDLSLSCDPLGSSLAPLRPLHDLSDRNSPDCLSNNSSNNNNNNNRNALLAPECKVAPSEQSRRCLTLARRRLGRGGRMWLDRVVVHKPLSPESNSRDINGVTDYSVELLTRLHASFSSGAFSDVPPSLPPFAGVAMAANAVPSDESDGDGGVSSTKNSLPGSPLSLFLTAEVLEGQHVGSCSDIHVASTFASLDNRLSAPEDVDMVVDGGDFSQSPPENFMEYSSPAAFETRHKSGFASPGSSLRTNSLDDSRQFEGFEDSGSELEQSSTASRGRGRRMRIAVNRQGISPTQHSSEQFALQPNSRFVLSDCARQGPRHHSLTLTSLHELPGAPSQCDTDLVPSPSSHTPAPSSSSHQPLPSMMSAFSLACITRHNSTVSQQNVNNLLPPPSAAGGGSVTCVVSSGVAKTCHVTTASRTSSVWSSSKNTVASNGGSATTNCSSATSTVHSANSVNSVVTSINCELVSGDQTTNSCSDHSEHCVNNNDSSCSNNTSNSNQLCGAVTSAGQARVSLSPVSTNQVRALHHNNTSNCTGPEILYVNTRCSSNNGTGGTATANWRPHHKVLTTRTASGAFSNPALNCSSGKSSSNSSTSTAVDSDSDGLAQTTTSCSSSSTSITTTSNSTGISNGPSNRHNVILPKTSTTPIPVVKCTKFDQYLFRDS